MNNPTNIKSMKLYSHIDRVYNELKEIGKLHGGKLSAADLAAFDQLHYHGTAAVDHAVAAIGITEQTRVLEIGAGFGGPARHIVQQSGAAVTALELQEDQNRLAADLSARCGMAGNPAHACGDFLSHDFGEQSFDAIVSWLALYHIRERMRMLEISRALLSTGGAFYAEDLFCRQPFTAADKARLASGLYAGHLPSFDDYQSEVAAAGFRVAKAEDMSDDWRAFTTARLAEYEAARERHIRVHGAATYEAMREFYAFVNGYFRSGKLGGIRLLAYAV